MLRLLTPVILLSGWLYAAVPTAAGDWNVVKNTADDMIYPEGSRNTFYCGCAYTSHLDDDGSGSIDDLDVCGYDGGNNSSTRAQRVEWEHIVPASLMPARRWACWDGPEGSRQRCEREDPDAQRMMFDLHNLAPSIGQVNQRRSNDRYADLPEDTSDFGSCQIEDASGRFEPPPCRRGDVARVWFYMHETHGVRIPESEWEMFAQWADEDPISPAELEREQRIFTATGQRNRFVFGAGASNLGSCGWETD